MRLATKTLALGILVAAGAAVLVTSWCRAKPAGIGESDLEQLQALGYVSEVPTDRAGEGVVTYDPDRAFPGLQCLVSRRRGKAFLLDMEGHPVHVWDLSGSEAATEHVELVEGGDLLAVKGVPGGLCRVKWDGDRRWCIDAHAHHDVDVDENGDLYLIVSKAIAVDVDGRTYPILDDRIARASPDGVILEEILSLWDLVGRRIVPSRWAAIRRYLGQHPEHRRSLKEASAAAARDIISDSPYDVFHTNSIEIIDREVPGLCQRGDLLLSVRELDLLLIVDPRTRAVRWEFGPGVISGQHDATLLESGHILLFDNGRSSGASRVIEADPSTREIVWSYDGRPGTPFYSVFRGAAQRLPNGNTLITDSANGRVIEVTKDGEIVWAYYTPETGPGMREAVYRVSRVVGEAARRVEARIAEERSPE